MAQKIPAPLVILRRKQVETRIGLGRSSIYEKLNAKSKYYDPSFPAPVSLGEKAVGWIEGEIDAWLTQRIAASRNVSR